MQNIRKWRLEEARNHFDEIISLAKDGQPQLVNDAKSHKEVYIILAKDYEEKEKDVPFNEFLLSIPKVADDEEEDLFARSPSKAREEF